MNNQSAGFEAVSWASSTAPSVIYEDEAVKKVWTGSQVVEIEKPLSYNIPVPKLGDLVALTKLMRDGQPVHINISEAEVTVAINPQAVGSRVIRTQNVVTEDYHLIEALRTPADYELFIERARDCKVLRTPGLKGFPETYETKIEAGRYGHTCKVYLRGKPIEDFDWTVNTTVFNAPIEEQEFPAKLIYEVPTDKFRLSVTIKFEDAIKNLRAFLEAEFNG